jgi:hypothetical protein
VALPSIARLAAKLLDCVLEAVASTSGSVCAAQVPSACSAVPKLSPSEAELQATPDKHAKVPTANKRAIAIEFPTELSFENTNGSDLRAHA